MTAAHRGATRPDVGTICPRRPALRKEKSATVDRRSRALIYLVGQSRAYLKQLELSAGELGELRDERLASLLETLAQAQTKVEDVNALGTTALRDDSEVAPARIDG